MKEEHLTKQKQNNKTIYMVEKNIQTSIDLLTINGLL